MHPNIHLTAPIASLMNVSGLNIDVGNATVQTSTAWSIPNISITPIPPNPTNTQIYDVSEAPGSTQRIPSKANTQSKSSHDFLLNLVESQEPLGKSKQPSLNIPSGSQAHVGYEKWVDGGKQKITLKNVTRYFGGESWIYSSSK
ncbi:hypothetical protein O181_000955 [Austropuccinia psidii MF-1]|uniref:Uncharacterized protein n=1 Tax=Austropuccinia psidii MF-1 TaxID=1389203 RepID=A0A9Q3B9T0_9BASI|nr:hypothetical protein [Austropuccinia psidii MF-1]